MASFRTNVRAATLQLWARGDAPAFVLAGGPCSADSASTYTRTKEDPADYAVVTHIDTTQEPWEVEMRLIRTIDGKEFGSARLAITLSAPESTLRELADKAIRMLREESNVELIRTPDTAKEPTGNQFGYYLLRLEQLLAVRAADRDGTPKSFLSGVRDIVAGNISLCADEPKNVVARLLLAQTLIALKKTRPEVVTEFQEPVNLLQTQKPLSSPCHEVIQTMLQGVFEPKSS